MKKKGSIEDFSRLNPRPYPMNLAGLATATGCFISPALSVTPALGMAMALRSLGAAPRGLWAAATALDGRHALRPLGIAAEQIRVDLLANEDARMVAPAVIVAVNDFVSSKCFPRPRVGLAV